MTYQGPPPPGNYGPPQPGNYGPPPGYYPPPPPPRKESNPTAVVGFIAALLGILLALPGAGLGWLFAIIGLIVSIIGVVRSGNGSGRGLAVTGIILAALSFPILAAHNSSAGTSTTAGSSLPTSTYSAPNYSTTPSYSATPTTEAAPTTTVAPVPETTFSDGTYEVGAAAGEVAPGTYRTDGGGGMCYWSRNKDTTGEFDSIIANGIVQGPTVITVGRSDGALELSGGCTWTKK